MMHNTPTSRETNNQMALRIQPPDIQQEGVKLENNIEHIAVRNTDICSAL